MMQTAQMRYGNDFASRRGIHFGLTSRRRFLGETQVRSVLVVVVDVFVYQALQMALVEDDHVVEQVPTATADQAFRHPVLPRTLEAGPLRLDAEEPDRLNHFIVEVRTAVEDQEFQCGVVWKSLAQLLAHPHAGRMSGHIEVQDAPPVVRNYKKAVQHSTGERGHREEVHRDDRPIMIAQER